MKKVMNLSVKMAKTILGGQAECGCSCSCGKSDQQAMGTKARRVVTKHNPY